MVKDKKLDMTKHLVDTLNKYEDGPVTVTENVGSKKKGEACASNVLGLFATGDASIEKARRQGDVAKVSSVDHSSFSLLFLYSKFCTVVHGE